MGLLAKVQHVQDKNRTDYTWVVDELVESFKDERRDGIWHQNWFRPSGLTYKWGAGVCPRYWSYIFNSFERFETIDAQSGSRMGHGTDRHSVIQERLRESPHFVALERHLAMLNPTVQGSCDVVMLNEDGEEVIGEIKTTTQENFFKRQLEGPPHYNVLQVALYMHMAGLSKGFILIENNNTRQVMIFPVEYTEELRAEIEELLEWMRTVEEAVKVKQQLPERVMTKSSYNCKGCAFRKACWDGPEGDVRIERSPAYGG